MGGVIITLTRGVGGLANVMSLADSLSSHLGGGSGRLVLQ